MAVEVVRFLRRAVLSEIRHHMHFEHDFLLLEGYFSLIDFGFGRAGSLVVASGGSSPAAARTLLPG